MKFITAISAICTTDQTGKPDPNGGGHLIIQSFNVSHIVAVSVGGKKNVIEIVLSNGDLQLFSINRNPDLLEQLQTAGIIPINLHPLAPRKAVKSAQSLQITKEDFETLTEPQLALFYEMKAENKYSTDWRG